MKQRVTYNKRTHTPSSSHRIFSALLNRIDGRLNALVAIYMFGVAVSLFVLLRHGPDIAFHLQRMDAIMQEFRNLGFSAFPIRVYHATLNGYGYASPLFYGDVFMWPFAILGVWLNLSVLTTFKILLAAVFLFMWFMTRFSFSLVFSGHDRDIAVALYMVSVTVFNDATGSWVGRDFAAMFVPLCFCSFFALIYAHNRKEWRYTAFLSIGVAGLLNSNVLDAVIVVFSLFVICLFICRDLRKDSILKIVAAAVLCIVLSSWFLAPMMEQMASQTFFVTSKSVKMSYDLHERTVPLIGLLFPYQISDYIYTKIGKEHWFRPEYFYGLLFFVVLVFFLFRKRCVLLNRKNKDRRFYVALVVLLLLFMLFQTKLFPHSLFTRFIGTFQFPWRVNLVMTCFGCFLSIYLIRCTGKTAYTSILLLCSACLVIINCAGTHGMPLGFSIVHGTPFAPYEASEYKYGSDSLGAAEYLPYELYDKPEGWREYINARGDVILCNDVAIVYDYRRDFDQLSIEFSENQGVATFELPLLYYKGYAAYDLDTGKEYTVEKSESGLVSITATEPSGQFSVFYQGTYIQKASEWCSLVSFSALLAAFIVTGKRQGKVRSAL